MHTHTKEVPVKTLSGWLMLLLMFLSIAANVALWVWFARDTEARLEAVGYPNFWLLGLAILHTILNLIWMGGFFTLQPNEARALILFGDYVGTERRSGFHWTNPFNTKKRISVRARNFNTPKLKVNDKRGNPIEIGAVVVWRVADTAEALFDVDNYEEFVSVQSESAVRLLASRYAYDDGEAGEITLRSGLDEISHDLQAELQNRLANAGVVVEEARLAHLAYAPEIAQAMLRRQQAEAVIAARQKIVHGAVSMVEMALTELADKQVVKLDDERRAAMVSNLLVVLCSENETHPVINTGTLHN
ncbi:MAG: SPFH domain-containing protein [Planctomycetota bacterium]|jgi:regulator of protease activity HflC (stomatin/prohibitin superfamily)|nr:SPFH domain-containing protein [Blastopirellula sp.]